MVEDKTGGNSPEDSATKLPQLKQTAQQHLNSSPRGTSSWQILNDLRLSIVDGGVNILKAGMDKLTGTSREHKPVSNQNQSASTEVSAVKESDHTRTATTLAAKTESETSNKVQTTSFESNAGSEPRTDAFGGDWLDYLMDSMGVDAPVAERSQSSPAQQPQVGPGHTIVERNEKLAVTKVTYPNGASTSISYDESDAPRPAVIACSDGREWRREGGRWFEYRAARFSGEILSGEFVIREDGTITKTNAANEAIEEWLANGDKLECPIDNPVVKKDASGMVVERGYAQRNGSSSFTYKYRQGRLVAVEMAGSAAWLMQADGTWQGRGGRSHPFEFNVSQCGDCVIFKNGRVITVQHRDGSETQVRWNGEKVWQRGVRPIEIVHSDGSYSQFSSDGRVTKDRNHNVISSTPQT